MEIQVLVRIWDTPYREVEAIAFIELIKQSILSVLGKWYQPGLFHSKM
ncbi:hypothetical protein [Nostoc sp.]